MQEEFQELCRHHNKRYQLLLDRYNQLEKMFAERPSRAEDVTKIKELINLKSLMDKEIQNYQKNMNTANEIVRYLNMELENYKETYDIFGKSDPTMFIGNSLKSVKGDDSTKLLEPRVDFEKAEKHLAILAKHNKTQSLEARTPDSPTLRKRKISFFREDPGETRYLEPKKSRSIDRGLNKSKTKVGSGTVSKKCKTERQADTNPSEIMSNA